MGLDPNERGYEFYKKGSRVSHQSLGVNVDISRALKMLDDVGEAMAGKALMAYGATLLSLETHRAFVAGVDPSTDRPWPSRRHPYPWPTLRRTGKLQGSLAFGWGIKTKSGVPKLYGKAQDTTYEDKPTPMIVAAVQFGRKQSRSSRGTRHRGVVARTGQTPPRPIFGMGASARNRFASRARRLIEKAAG